MDLFKNNVVAGVGLAFAATVLAPVLMPAMGRIGRPLAKSLVRGAMLMVDKGREVIAVAGESVEDIMAEVRAESAMTAASSQGQPPGSPFASSTTAGATKPASQSAPGATPAQTVPAYSGNGASHGTNGAAPDNTAPDGATGSEAGNI